MRIIYLLVLLAWSWTAAAQDVWKYVDEQGVTHYTDQFVPGAVKVQLSSGSATAAEPASNRGSATSDMTRAAPQRAYRSFQIVRPANQDSVVNTGGALQVVMTLEPALLSGHSVTLYLDGKLVPEYPPNSLDHELQNVPRGEHTLVGVIIDENARRVLETAKVTFTLRQNSVLMNPPVGPSLRPPPKAPTAPRAPTRGSPPSFADLRSGRTAPADSPAL
jgi:hypothetical protein